MHSKLAGGHPGAWVAQLPWPEMERRLAAGAVALLPVAAGSKEHGYHLPLGTDLLQVEWLVDRLLVSEPVLAWPPLSYGYYPFADYPGSISLSRDAFERVVDEILQGIVAAGAPAVAVLNAGISTIEPLQAALARLGRRISAGLVNVYEGPRLTRALAALQEQAWGGHADEIETSLLLAIAPEQVEMAVAQPSPGPIPRGPLQRRDPSSPGYSPSGAVGDPRLATAAKGERLLAAMLEDVRAMLRTSTTSG